MTAHVAINVGILILLAVPGFVLRRLKVIKPESIGVLVALLIYVAQPSTVIKSFLTLKFSAELALNILVVLTVFSATMLGVLFLSILIFRKKETDRDHAEVEADEPNVNEKPSTDVDSRMLRFASMFGNTGYLGLPMVMLLFPNQPLPVLYTSLCIVVFNLFTWTVGVLVLTGDRKRISLKRVALSPVPVVTALSLPFFFVDVAVPAEISGFFNTLGQMTTPLSMIILGARLAEMRLGEVFGDVRVYAAGALRLVAAPLIAFALLKLLKVSDQTVFNTTVMVCAMPCAAAGILFAERFLPNSRMATKCVLCTSILCVATIPLLGMIL